MIRHHLALLKREIWEHRSIYVTPVAILSIVTLGVITMLVFASGYGEQLDIVIFGAQNVAGDTERKAVLTAFFLGTSWVFLIALAILTIFYCLDSLYAERKDKSILFWRSLPVTDAETVISKLITAAFVIPTVTVVGIIITHLINLLATGIWVSIKGGDAGMLIWGSVSLLDNWAAAFVVVIATGIWMAPFFGWFLLVSAYTKRSPLLMAFMPLFVLGFLEKIILRTHIFAETVLGRGKSLPIFRSIDIEQFFEDEDWHRLEGAASLFSHIDLVRFFTSPSMWAGLLVCGLLVTGAIYVRRYRDES